MMNFIQKVSDKLTVTKAEEVSFCEEYDVAVAGLGVAGAISAVTSAGKNLKTLGIERFNAPGGTMTTGGVNGYYFGGSGGIFEQIDDRVREKCTLVTAPAFENPDLRKHILDAAIANSGVHTMYESIITGVYANGRRIAGIRVCSGGVERDIAVRVLIDATGDGDICDIAGCSMNFGREADGSIMPFTIVKSYMRDGRLERTNHDCGKVDHRNVSAYSRAVLEANAAFAQRNTDENMVRLQPLPGIREGRLLDGEKKIKLENFLNGIYDKDPVMYAYADLDKHGADTAFDSDLFRKWHILSNLGALNISVPVPLGCLIAKEYDNLLAAGRCLSVDHEMLTCIRMSRDMQKTGEIAAIAAYVGITDHVPLKDIKYERILPFLKETGCFSGAEVLREMVAERDRTALLDILNAFPARRKEVEKFLEQEFSSLAYIKKITPLDQYASEYVIAKGIYEYICIWRERH